MSRKTDAAKAVVKNYYRIADCGIFDSRNTAGDKMETIYEKDGLQIDICFGYAYLEVFGLSSEEFDELDRFYHALRDELWDKLLKAEE